jgi:hypothetical protein
VNGWPVTRLCRITVVITNSCCPSRAPIPVGDRQPGPARGQDGIVVEIRHQDLAFVEFRVGQAG